jgi:hypothetical protein
MAKFDEYIEKVSRYVAEMRSRGERAREFDHPGFP